jgi:hypothetical protein
MGRVILPAEWADRFGPQHIEGPGVDERNNHRE